MADKKVPQNASEMVNALFDFIQGPEEDVREVPIERVLKDLKKKGIDPAPVLKMVNERLAGARAQDSLRRAREEREQIARLVAGRSGQRFPPGDLKRRILEILGSRPELAPAYRKFEEATEADLETLLEDLNLLDELNNDDAK